MDRKIYIIVAAILILICSCNGTGEYRQAEDLYKAGVSQFKRDKSDSAIWNLKHAEELAIKANNDSLLQHIRNYLSKANARSANYELALHYAYMVYNDARQRNDSVWLAGGCNALACIYDLQGNANKAFRYIDELKKYAEFGSSYERAYYLMNIGIFYMRKHQDDRAKEYLNKSLYIHPLDEAFCPLAVIYGREGNIAEADRLWQIALKTKDLFRKVNFLSALSIQYKEMGRYKESCEINEQMLSLRDSLAKQQQGVKIQELQLKYDQQVLSHRLERNFFLSLFGVLLLVAIFAGIAVYLHMKQQRLSRLVSDSQSLVDAYNRQIMDMERSGNETINEVKELKHRISSLQKKQNNILSSGHKVYQEIENGGRTLRWTKENFESYVEYYKVIDLPFVQHIETEYDKLSSSNKFLMILMHKGKTDDEIQQIMGVSNGALRTAKYRIKKKYIAGN